MTGTLSGKVRWHRQAWTALPSSSNLCRRTMGAAAVPCSIIDPGFSSKSNLDLKRAEEVRGDLAKAHSAFSPPQCTMGSSHAELTTATSDQAAYTLLVFPHCIFSVLCWGSQLLFHSHRKQAKLTSLVSPSGTTPWKTILTKALLLPTLCSMHYPIASGRIQVALFTVV